MKVLVEIYAESEDQQEFLDDAIVQLDKRTVVWDKLIYIIAKGASIDETAVRWQIVDNEEALTEEEWEKLIFSHCSQPENQEPSDRKEKQES